jgi:adenylate cyclase
MLARVTALNEALSSELPFPLRVGIGIHTGEAIVGSMGPPRAQITTAIGDTINIAARLEGLTKEYGVPLIVSAHAAERAALPCDGLRSDSVQLRGRVQPFAFYLLDGEILEKSEA